MTETVFHLKRHLTSFQIMILGFAGVILLGALALMLPIASAQRVWTPFHEALFTSTSAVCVTGLVVQDTGSYWSAFGQTVILSATALLITIPVILFYLTDFADLSVGERILASLFQAVTPRTAGYNTVDLTEMSDTSKAVTVLLMLTGGGPGSTAGGMKVTTLAVLIANAVAAFRRQEDPQLFHRRLEHSAIRNAAANSCCAQSQQRCISALGFLILVG